MLDARDLRQQLQFPLQVQLYGATLNFVANEDFRENPKTPGIFSVNTDAPTYRGDLYRAAMAARPGAALAALFLGAWRAPAPARRRKTRRNVAFWARAAPWDLGD